MAEKKIQWNKAQVKAIESRDGSVLVSAAAGSGKTAVLVERVIERICDEKNPCPADGVTKRQESKDIIDELKVRVPDVKDRIFSSIEGAGIDGWVRH